MMGDNIHNPASMQKVKSGRCSKSLVFVAIPPPSKYPSLFHSSALPLSLSDLFPPPPSSWPFLLHPPTLSFILHLFSFSTFLSFFPCEWPVCLLGGEGLCDANWSNVDYHQHVHRHTHTYLWQRRLINQDVNIVQGHWTVPVGNSVRDCVQSIVGRHNMFLAINSQSEESSCLPLVQDTKGKECEDACQISQNIVLLHPAILITFWKKSHHLYSSIEQIYKNRDWMNLGEFLEIRGMCSSLLEEVMTVLVAHNLQMWCGNALSHRCSSHILSLIT